MNAVPTPTKFSELPLIMQWHLDPWLPIQDGIVITLDETNSQLPIAAMPAHEYLWMLTREWQRESVMLIHKSRRMMLSWLFVWLLLHDAITKVGRTEGYQSEDLTLANVLLDRAEHIYDHLPNAFFPGGNKYRCRRKRKDPAELWWPGQTSRIIGFPQGKDQLRSYTCSNVMADEVAFQEKFLETFGALAPTMESHEFDGLIEGGKLVMLSSGVVNTDFHRMCLDAEELAHGRT